MEVIKVYVDDINVIGTVTLKIGHNIFTPKKIGKVGKDVYCLISDYSVFSLK